MNKLFTILALAFLSMTLNTACTKTYDCSCETASGSHDHFKITGKDDVDADAQCGAKEIGNYTDCEVE